MRSGKTLYAQDLYGGADPKYRIKTRVFTELRLALAVHPPAADPARSAASSTSFVPEFTIVDLPIVQGRSASATACAPTP